MSVHDKGISQVRVELIKLLVICIYTGVLHYFHIIWNSCHWTATYRVTIIIHLLNMFHIYVWKLHEDDNKDFLDMFKHWSHSSEVKMIWFPLDSKTGVHKIFPFKRLITHLQRWITYIHTHIYLPVTHKCELYDQRYAYIPG